MSAVIGPSNLFSLQALEFRGDGCSGGGAGPPTEHTPQLRARCRNQFRPVGQTKGRFGTIWVYRGAGPPLDP